MQELPTMHENIQTPHYMVIKTGTIITHTGWVGLIVLSISGSIVVDGIIILSICFAGEAPDSNVFFTIYYIDTINNTNNTDLSLSSSIYTASAQLLAVSTIPMSLTIGLCYYYHHLLVMEGFGYGWAVAGGLTLLGLAVHAIGEKLSKSPTMQYNQRPLEVIEPSPPVTTQALVVDNIPIAFARPISYDVLEPISSQEPTFVVIDKRYWHPQQDMEESNRGKEADQPLDHAMQP